jgi:PAS domain S-box-containing protein
MKKSLAVALLGNGSANKSIHLILKDSRLDIDHIYNWSVHTIHESNISISSPDVFLLVECTDEKSSIETIEAVKKKCPFSALIAITHSQELGEHAVSHGADSYLLEGEYDRNTLKEIIRLSLRSKEMSLRQQQLSSENLQLRMTLSAARMFIMDIDYETSRICLSEDSEKVIGHNINDITDVAKLFSIIHPDDRIHARRVFDQFKQGRPFNFQFRIVRPDGQIVWLERRAYITYGNDSVAAGSKGLLIDVTELKNAEEQLFKAYQQLEVAASHQASILNAIPAELILLNKQGIIVAMNDAWKKATHNNWLRNRQDESLSFTHQLACSPETINDIHAGVQQVLDRKTPAYSVEYASDATHEKKWFSLTTSPLVGDTEGGAVIMCIDITDRKLIEESLSRAQANLITLFDNTDDSFVLIDKHYKLMAFNKQAQRNSVKLFNKAFEIDHSILDYIGEDTQHAFLENLRLAEKDRVVEFDVKYNAADAHQWFHLKIKAIRSFDGLIGFNISGHNFTAHKLSEIRLRESEKRFRALIENSGDMFTIIGSYNQVKYSSPNIGRILGYENVQGQINIDDFFLQEEKEGFLTLLEKAKQNSGKIYRHVNRMRHKDGSLIWVEGSLVDLSHIHAINGLVYNFRDITKRKQIETELQQSQYFLERAMDVAELGYWIVDLKNEWKVRWSKQTYKLYGTHQKEFAETLEGFYELVHPSDIDNVKSIIDNATKTLSPYSFNHRCTWPDQTIHWLHAEAEFTFDDDGTPHLLVGVVQDITQSVLKEEALRQSKQSLDALINSTNDLVWSIDKYGKLTAANTSYKLMVEKNYRTQVQVGGNVLLENVPEEEQKQWAERYKKVLAGYHVSEELHGLEGPGTYFDLRLNPISDGKRIFGVSGYCRDITEMKKAEKAIKAINERYEILSKATNDAVWDWNIVTGSVRWNHGLEHLFGFHFHEQQNEISWLFENIHPDDRTEVSQSFKTSFANELTNWNSNFRFKSFDESYKYVFARGYIVYEVGKPVRMIGSIQNIHELTQYRMSLEQKVLERTRELNQAMEKEKELAEIKSRFVSMASHEFRTPLAAIDFAAGFLQSYRGRISDDEVARKLQTIEKQVQHMTSLLDDVLTVGKSESNKIPVVIRSLHLRQFLEELVSNVTRATKPSDEIVVLMDIDHDEIDTDEKLLQNILTNLLTNAVKFSLQKTPVYFTCRKFQNELSFQVKDNGIGITEDDMKTIFEPFNRGSNVGTISGTGLGLTIVKKAVDLLNGNISVNSAAGETIFNVQIPLYREHTIDGKN